MASLQMFIESLDDAEWQSSLYSLLQNQTFNQVEVDMFELMCEVLDQNIFAQVDWARNSCLFKELEVGVQMRLLQDSWSTTSTSGCTTTCPTRLNCPTDRSSSC